MDEQTRIQTYKESLRLIYAADLAGLRTKIATLHTEAEENDIVVTSTSFEGEQSAGQVLLEPLAKLNAAISLLKELDPDNIPAAEDTVVFADFRGGALET